MNTDERLGERLRSLSAPTTSEQEVLRRLETRRRRRLAAQRLQRVGLAVIVVALTVGGFAWATSIFGDEPTPSSPGSGAILVGRQQVQVFPGGGTGFSDPEAWLLAPDGQSEHGLDLMSGAVSPTWSPDGSHIAYLRESDEGTFGPAWDLVVTDDDGSNPAVWAEGLPRSSAPVVQWSPDGASIAVLGSGDPGSVTSFDHFGLPLVDIELIQPDGAEFVTHGGAIGSFGWSPTGDTFAAVVQVDDENNDLVSIGLDGSERLIAHDAMASVPPSWSPDGSSVVFARASKGVAGDASETDLELWIVPNLGDPPRQLTSDGGLKLAVAWIEEGSHLLYSRATPTSCDVVSVSADGTDQRVLADRDSLGGCAVSLSVQPQG